MNTLITPKPVLETKSYIGYKEAPELEPGQTVGSDYEVVGRILDGKLVIGGGKADIYRAQHIESGDPAVVKVQKNMSAENYVSHFALEAELHRALSRHTDHVPRFLDGGLGVDDQGRRFSWLALEEMATSMDREIKRADIERQPLDFETVRNILVPSLGVVALMQEELGVAHVDIKPSNLFVDRNGRGRLGDFGSASAIETVNVTALREYDMPVDVVTQPLNDHGYEGTIGYVPPEAHGGHGMNEVNLRQADSYAAGMTLHRCVGGRMPYGETHTVNGRMQTVEVGLPVAEYDNTLVPKEIAYLVLSLTDPDPTSRMTVREAVTELERI